MFYFLTTEDTENTEEKRVIDAVVERKFQSAGCLTNILSVLTVFSVVKK